MLLYKTVLFYCSAFGSRCPSKQQLCADPGVLGFVLRCNSLQHRVGRVLVYLQCLKCKDFLGCAPIATPSAIKYVPATR